MTCVLTTISNGLRCVAMENVESSKADGIWLTTYATHSNSKVSTDEFSNFSA